MQETRVWSLSREDPLEEEMAIHSSTIAWKIPWTEEPGRLQSMGSQRAGHDWATSLHFTQSVLQALLWGGYHREPYFNDKDSKAKESCVTNSRPHSKEWSSNSRTPSFKSHTIQHYVASFANKTANPGKRGLRDSADNMSPCPPLPNHRTESANPYFHCLWFLSWNSGFLLYSQTLPPLEKANHPCWRASVVRRQLFRGCSWP